jgi:hypothetical protein
MQKREFLMKKIQENLVLEQTNAEKEVVVEKKEEVKVEEVKVEEKPVVLPTANKKKKVAKEETTLEETKQEP